MMATLETLNFDNSTLRALPVDEIEDNYSREVVGACFVRVKPTPVESPEVVAVSVQAMELLDLPEDELEREEFAEYFSGRRLLNGSETYAHCYCGHQYGTFKGQLGDGATIYLGEIVSKRGERWEVQLKGAGRTPFSRIFDGRKVLRSSVREFLCSEAMHHLGIPTTRAGACVTSNSTVIRDVHCDGRESKEKVAIVTRIAETFFRFGSFEICRPKTPQNGNSGPSAGKLDILSQLLNYTIANYYPEVERAFPEDLIKKYRQFYKEVVRKTAKLVAAWQCVGFCHGMLNTDNMNIVGLTIDYGPFCFLDRYNPEFVPSNTDFCHRHAYKQQPEICYWNLRKLAESLEPLLPFEESTAELDLFMDEYKKCYLDNMYKKFGLVQRFDNDKNLFDKFLDTMEQCGSDFTNSFRALSVMNLPGSPNHSASVLKLTQTLLSSCASVTEMKERLDNSLEEDQIEFLMSLYECQPDILEEMRRNHKILQELRVMTPESKNKSDKKKWNSWLSLYVKRLHRETVGVSDIKKLNREREATMNSNNPRFVLRNYIAQNAINLAEAGDFSEVRKVMKILQSPFTSTAVELPTQSDFVVRINFSTRGRALK